MIMRFRPANIRLINRRQNLPRLLLALSSQKETNNNKTTPQIRSGLTGHSISVSRQGIETRRQFMDVYRGGGANLLGSVLIDKNNEEIAGLDVEAGARVGLVSGGCKRQVLAAERLFRAAAGE